MSTSKTIYLRDAYESYLKYKGWTVNTTMSAEAVRYAVLGALCGAPEDVNKADLLRIMSVDFALMADVCLRESKYSQNGSTTQIEAKPAMVSNVLSINDVVAEFGYPKNSLKSKQWRDENGFPYRQLKTNGKVTYYRNEVVLWDAQHNAN